MAWLEVQFAMRSRGASEETMAIGMAPILPRAPTRKRRAPAKTEEYRQVGSMLGMMVSVSRAAIRWRGEEQVGLSFEQIGPTFAARVIGIDVTRALSSEEAAAIEAGMDRYAVLVFPDQKLTDEQQVAFTERLGPLESTAAADVTKPEDRRLGAKLADVSNLDQHGKPLARDDRRRMFNLGNQLWHSDSSFRRIPARYSILSGRVVASDGGNTEFADMRAAYDALDERTKAEVEDLICEHSLMYSRGALGFDELSDGERAMFKPVLQRLVRTHPVTGRRSLFLSSHAGTIVGWPVPEARAFLRDLNEHATAERFRFVHRWRQHDLVIWDNRTTMHRVRRFDPDQVRDMRRTTIAGDAPTVQAQAA